MRKERDELEKELLSKKEPQLADLASSQPIHIAKHEKTVLKTALRVDNHLIRRS